MTAISSSTRFTSHAKNFLAWCGVLFAMSVQASIGVADAFNSFTGDTLVHTRDASGRALLKPISQLTVGDEVLAWDESQDDTDYAALTSSTDGDGLSLSLPEPGEEGLTLSRSGRGQGEGLSTSSSTAQPTALRYERITDVFNSHHQQQLVHITLDTDETITATAGHPLRTTEGWRDAILLKRGGKLLIRGDADSHLFEGEGGNAQPAPLSSATIVDVRIEVATVAVFNLEAANTHTFFVGEEGYLAHNARSSTSGHSSHARGGQEYHQQRYPPGYEREQQTPDKTGRVDAVNTNTKTIIERKYTDRPETIARGKRQLMGYCKKFGKGYKGILEIKSPSTGRVRRSRIG